MHKITQIYSQRHPMHPTAHKPLNSHYMHSLHDPWANRRAGTAIRPHISTSRVHIHTPTRSHDHTRAPQWRTSRNTPEGHIVGCIYASSPQFKSNILQCHFVPFKSIVKMIKQLKNILSNFSVFLLTFIIVLFQFLFAIYCTKVRVFASTSTFDSKLRKRLPTCWLYLTIWLPDAQGTKGPGKEVYASETHLRMASLLSVYTHWGGEPQCICTIYLLISFVVCILHSIYSQI